MYKILKIVPFGIDKILGNYYSVFYCDPEDYDVLKNVDYSYDYVIVYDLHDCMPGDLIKIKKYYNLSDFSDVHYEIYKIKN